jgi:hypothetical protein
MLIYWRVIKVPLFFFLLVLLRLLLRLLHLLPYHQLRMLWGMPRPENQNECLKRWPDIMPERMPEDMPASMSE